MMGVVGGPIDLKYCSSNDPLLQAEWTVWDGEHIVDHGSIPNRCACKFEDKYIYKFLGSFAGEASKKYVVEVKFTKDGTPLNAVNPHLLVIQHGKN
jgi:acyl-homoserine lactone acylase PvdQ